MFEEKAPNISTLRPLVAGDVIIDSKPIVHIIYNPFKGKYCDNCLENNDSLKKCSNCLQMYYCGKNCQRIDWKYHNNECKVLAKKKFNYNQINWSERLLIRFWLKIKSDQTFATKTYQLFDGSNVCLNDIKVNIKELLEDFQRMSEFRLICNHFKVYGIEFNRKELLHWFGLITTSTIGYEFKFYHKPQHMMEVIGEILTVGHGLYPQLCRVSHSCIANSVVVSNGNKYSFLSRMLSLIVVFRSFTTIASNQTNSCRNTNIH